MSLIRYKDVEMNFNLVHSQVNDGRDFFFPSTNYARKDGVTFPLHLPRLNLP